MPVIIPHATRCLSLSLWDLEHFNIQKAEYT